MKVSGFHLEILLRGGQRLNIENLWGAAIQAGVLIQEEGGGGQNTTPPQEKSTGVLSI